MYNVYLFFLPDVKLIELDGHSLSVENVMRIGRGELRVKVKKTACCDSTVLYV